MNVKSMLKCFWKNTNQEWFSFSNINKISADIFKLGSLYVPFEQKLHVCTQEIAFFTAKEKKQ